MRGALIRLVFALVACTACRADVPLAPSKPGQLDRNPDIPADLFASYAPVELPGAAAGIVTDVNDAGDAVGIADGAGAIWRGAAHTRDDLPFVPEAIANDGTIAGYLGGHAVMFRNGQLIVLDTAPSAATAICRCASETVVGSVEVNGEQHAAIWVGGVRIDAGVPPGGNLSEFTAAANGRFVGVAGAPTVDPNTGATVLSTQAFLWSHATGWRRLSSDNALQSFVSGVNNHGISVGSEVRAVPPNLLGIVFDTLSEAVQLSADASFLEERIPYAINDSGTIAGNFPGAFSGSATPGPNGIALVMSVSGSALVLPPGAPGDVATSINATNVIGGQSGGKPVLWVPSP